MPNLETLPQTVIQGELARRSLKEFIRLFWSTVEPNYRHLSNWHIDCIADHLAHVWQIKNLLINIPPRCSKSLTIGVFWPAWLWLTKPGTKFLFCSYGLELSEESSVKCRDLIKSDLYQSLYGNQFTLSETQNKKEHFTNDHGGSRQATSIGGVATGFGADALIVDDAHNVKRAESDLDRETTTRFFSQSFFTRLNDFRRGCRIVVGQRVHKKDLSGWILENCADDWTHLNLPYEYRPTATAYIGWPKLKIADPRTEDSQPLWPDRFPEAEVRQLRRNRATWETQFNQNPIDAEQQIFRPETFQYYTEEGDYYNLGNRQVHKAECVRWMAVDPAMSESKRADYTAIAVVDVTPFGDFIIVNLLRDKVGVTRLVPTIKAHFEAYRPLQILIEQYGHGAMVAGLTSAILQDGRREGLPVVPVKTNRAQSDGTSLETDIKIIRSMPLRVRFDDLKVWFPKGKTWVGPLEKELLDFPSGHDDQVDALSYIAAEANRRTRRARPVENTIETEEERKAKEEKQRFQALWHGVL